MGFKLAQGLIFSRAAEILKTVFSSRGRPIICSPIGSLFLLNPAGTDAAGKPAKFIGKVNGKYPHQGSTSRPSISFMVSNGPNASNASTARVGVTITSNCSNAELNTDLI